MIACRVATSFGSVSVAKTMHGSYPDAAQKDSFILLKMNDFSRNSASWRAPSRPSPVNALPQHRELGRGQPNDTVGRRWPGEMSVLQDPVIQTKNLLVPIQKFDSVTFSSAEGKDRARAGILPEHLLSCRGKALNPLTQIRNATGDINTDPNDSSMRPGPIMPTPGRRLGAGSHDRSALRAGEASDHGGARSRL